jgi:hypothetical protein
MSDNRFDDGDQLQAERPSRAQAMSDSTADIQAHLNGITEELLHGKNSHEDPTLPENWERLERGGNTPTPEDDIDLRETVDLTSHDARIRNAEAVGGQAPL